MAKVRPFVSGEEEGEATEVTGEDGRDGRPQVQVALTWNGKRLEAEVTV